MSFCLLCVCVCVCVCVYCPTATGHLFVTYLQLKNITYHIVSYHIVSYHIVSYQIVSYRIVSYHFKFNTGDGIRGLRNAMGLGPTQTLRFGSTQLCASNEKRAAVWSRGTLQADLPTDRLQAEFLHLFTFTNIYRRNSYICLHLLTFTGGIPTFVYIY